MYKKILAESNCKPGPYGFCLTAVYQIHQLLVKLSVTNDDGPECDAALSHCIKLWTRLRWPHSGFGGEIYGPPDHSYCSLDNHSNSLGQTIFLLQDQNPKSNICICICGLSPFSHPNFSHNLKPFDFYFLSGTC